MGESSKLLPYKALLGRVLRAHRAAADMDQTQTLLALNGAMSQPAISRVERGRGTIDVETAAILAGVYGVPPSEIFRATDRLRNYIEDEKGYTVVAKMAKLTASSEDLTVIDHSIAELIEQRQKPRSIVEKTDEQ